MTKFTVLSFLFAAISGLFSLSMSSATSSVSMDRQVTLDLVIKQEDPLTFDGFTVESTKKLNTENFYETVGTMKNTLNQTVTVVMTVTPSLIDPHEREQYEGSIQVGVDEQELDLEDFTPLTFTFLLQADQLQEVEAVFEDNKDTYLTLSFSFELDSEDGTYHYEISDSTDHELRVTIK